MLGGWHDLYDRRELLWTLIVKDVKVRYKQTYLGIGWAIFMPFMMMVVFTFLFRRVARVDTGEIPYPLFSYTGLVPWAFFASGLTMATQSLTQNIHLLTKVRFPREVFPLSAVLSKLLDLLIASVLVAVLMVWFHFSVTWHVVLILPVLAMQIMLMIGLAYFLSALNLFFRDVRYVFDAVIQLWMFATSVVYPIKSANEWLQMLLALNPMTPILNTYRSVLLLHAWPDWWALGVAATISLVVFVAGVSWFRHVEYLFAERI